MRFLLETKPSVFGNFIFVLLMWVSLAEMQASCGVQRVQVSARRSTNILK